MLILIKKQWKLYQQRKNIEMSEQAVRKSQDILREQGNFPICLLHQNKPYIPKRFTEN